MWIRTCQECGHKQTDTKPQDKGMSEAYTERKCKRCKSIALDYGKSDEPVPEDED